MNKLNILANSSGKCLLRAKYFKIFAFILIFINPLLHTNSYAILTDIECSGINPPDECFSSPMGGTISESAPVTCTDSTECGPGNICNGTTCVAGTSSVGATPTCTPACTEGHTCNSSGTCVPNEPTAAHSDAPAVPTACPPQFDGGMVATQGCNCGTRLVRANHISNPSRCNGNNIVDLRTECQNTCASSPVPGARPELVQAGTAWTCSCVSQDGSHARSCTPPATAGAEASCGEPVVCDDANAATCGGSSAADDGCPNKRRLYREIYAESASGGSEEVSADSVMPGTDLFKKCQQWASHNWQEMLSATPQGNTEYNFNKAYVEKIDEIHRDMRRAVQPPPAPTSGAPAAPAAPTRCDIKDGEREEAEEVFKAGMKALRDRYGKVRSCWAVLKLTTAVRDPRRAEERRKGEEAKSFDSKISCHDEGAETQDYFACKSMVDAYNAVQVGHKATEVVQTIESEVHNTDQMTAATADANDPTAAMRFQESSIRKQAEQAFIRGGIEAALAAVLGGYASSFPSKDSVVAHCHRTLPGNAPGVGDEAFEKIRSTYMIGWARALNMESVGDEAQHLTVSNVNVSADSDLCSYTADQGQLNLIANSRARESAIAQAVDMGMKAVVSEAKGAILQNQADKIAAAIARVKGLAVGVPPLPEDVALLTEACAADPTQSFCSELGFNSDVGFASNNINISGVGRGTSGANGSGSGSGGSGSTNEGAGKTDRSGVPGSIGSSVAGLDRDNRFEDTANSPGRLKSGGGGPGGGGGGSAGGGGGGGGGGGAPGGGGGGGGPINVPKVGYGDGGKYQLKASGGGGTGGKKDGENKNPFSDLFGKGKAGGDKGDLNFRGPAAIGDASGSIFDTISKRYGAVSGDRLLKYESVK